MKIAEIYLFFESFDPDSSDTNRNGSPPFQLVYNGTFSRLPTYLLREDYEVKQVNNRRKSRFPLNLEIED
jgi:hypothetical protein